MWLLLGVVAYASSTGCAGAQTQAADPSVDVVVPVASLTSEPSTAFDHRYKSLNSLYEGAVHPRDVDYVLLRTRKAKLDALVQALADVDVSGFNADQTVAFWTNAYNAITLQLIVDNPGIDSIMKLDDGGVWKSRSTRVAGQDITLDAIEHVKLRPITDGRIHAAISCASKGCPPLGQHPLTGTGVDAQLDAAAHRWVSSNAFDQTGDTLHLSEIFKWFPEDFARWRKSAVPGANEAQTRAVWFIAAYSDDNTGSRVTAGALKPAWQPYDWTLNQSPR